MGKHMFVCMYVCMVCESKQETKNMNLCREPKIGKMYLKC